MPKSTARRRAEQYRRAATDPTLTATERARARAQAAAWERIAADQERQQRGQRGTEWGWRS